MKITPKEQLVIEALIGYKYADKKTWKDKGAKATIKGFSEYCQGISGHAVAGVLSTLKRKDAISLDAQSICLTDKGRAIARGVKEVRRA